MEQIMNYIKPELVVVAIVLYFVGMALKQSQTVKDKFIPIVLGCVGIILATIYVVATCPLGTMQEIAKQQNALKDTVDNLSAIVLKIKETVESGGTVVPEPEPPIVEEYPAWEPHNGIPPVKWQKNSKCTHNGKKWESMVDNNVWEPGAFGVGEEIWREVIAE